MSNDDTPDWVDIHNDEALALVDDSSMVLQFIVFRNLVTPVEEPAGGMSATPVGQHSGSFKSLQSSDGGTSYACTQTSDQGVITCHATGNIIATPTGPHPVETKRSGDLVTTLDHGPQAIRWTRSGDQQLENGEADAEPILIKAGALGRNLSEYDLIVSPQHRILVGGARQLDGFSQARRLRPRKP